MRVGRLLVLFVLFSQSSYSQQLTQDPTLERGMKPYGTFEGGSIDSVSMTNGDLNLRIPLVSYPQRGDKLHLSFYLKYQNNSYIHTPQGAAGCNVTRPPSCEYGDNVLGPGLGIVSEFDLRSYVSGVIPPTNGPYATIVTPDGSNHEMGATATGWRL